MIQNRLFMACVILGLAGCANPGSHKQAEAQDAVAGTFSKAAEYVFSNDWIGYDEPLTEAFSRGDLRILKEHLPHLQSMTETALGVQDSVWGAKLAGYYRMSKLLPLLRSKLLIPRPCYCWEGPDYSKPESYLADSQYQYSVAYLQSIEAITGKPLDKAVSLTQAEAKSIAEYARNENSEYHHWALWMQRKLGIMKEPDQNLKATGTPAR